MPTMTAQWIEFVDAGTSKSGVTRIWSVQSKSQGAILGYIQWFGRWRCYAFDPLAETVYNAGCLRDIARFCEQATAEHRDR